MWSIWWYIPRAWRAWTDASRQHAWWTIGHEVLAVRLFASLDVTLGRPLSWFRIPFRFANFFVSVYCWMKIWMVEKLMEDFFFCRKLFCFARIMDGRDGKMIGKSHHRSSYCDYRLTYCDGFLSPEGDILTYVHKKSWAILCWSMSINWQLHRLNLM